MIWLMRVSIDLAEVLSSEGSAGELQMDDMPGDCWIGW
jgi:hypothetical protein